MTVRTLCPAKINLSLVVLPPHASGLHPIRTIFQAVDLCDSLSVTRLEDPGARTTIGVSFENCPAFDWPEDNTVAKTLRLVSEMLTVPALRIELVKRIPTESGLGGGSSDAAALLRVLGRFLPVPLTEDQRSDLAAAVGWDVPFFMIGGHAQAEGYGERVKPLDDPEEAWYVLAMPPMTVSSGAAYSRLDDEPYEPPPGFPVGHNDFERVAPDASRALIERLRALRASPGMLSGSGSAVFGRFPSRPQAEQCREILDREGVPWTAVARRRTRAESLAVQVEA